MFLIETDVDALTINFARYTGDSISVWLALRTIIPKEGNYRKF